MALTVGELVAYIRADGTQFDSQVDQSDRRFDGLGRVVSAGTKQLATSFVALTTGAAAMGAAVFKIGADYNRLQQSSRAALTTLLGSAEAANAQMDKLDEFAKSSPFAKQVFITAQQQLLGFGVAADRVLPTLDAIQNAVAAVGGSNEQVSQVTYALAQMQGQGKLTGETLNQLGQYGIDAATVLGQQLGKTGAEIRELASKPGGIPVDQVWDPLVTGLMQRFGGATANIKLQMDGALDRVKGAIRDIGSLLAAPFIDPKGGGSAVEWTNKVADALRAAEQKAKPFVDLMVARFKPALDAVTPALDKARSVINSWDLSKVNGQLDRLTAYTPLIATGAAALYAYGTQSIPILSTLGLTINPVVAGIAALVATSPGLRNAGADFVTALGPLAPLAGQISQVLSDTALQIGNELTPSLTALLQALAPVIVSLGQQLAPVLIDTVKYAVPVAEVIANVVAWVAELPTPVLAGAGAFAAIVAVLPKLVSGMQGVAATAAAAGGALKAAFIGNPVTLAIAAIATAVGIFVTRATDAKQRVDTMADSLDQATGAITANTRALVYNNLEKDGLIEKAKRLGVNLNDLVTASIDPTSDAYQRLADAEAAAKDESQFELGDLGATNDRLERLRGYSEILVAVRGQSEDVAKSQQQVRDQVAAGITATDLSTDAYGRNADALKTSTERLQDSIDKQNEAAGAVLSLREAQIRALDAQAGLTQAIVDGAAVVRDQNGAIDEAADGTRRVDDALIAWTRDQVASTDAMVKNNASAAELDKTIRAQRDSFIENAQQLGYTREEAEKLATSYGLIPNKVITTIKAEAAEAQLVIDKFIMTNDGRRIRVTVDTVGGTTYNYSPGNKFAMSAQAAGGVLEFYAAGGMRQKLTPMAAVAQMVPANTWRVVGDRPRGDEAYIPIERTTASLALLDETADRLGRITVPKSALQLNATGSITPRPVAQTSPAAAAWAGPPVQITVQGDLTGDGARTLADDLPWLLATQPGGA
ncbi:tape measure protein [Cellulomonas sp. P4]|uniref:tape measure protein n=1 Tax=Cellulomonas sp. P4 TaxID=3142533 RepID=UPI0031B9D691